MVNGKTFHVRCTCNIASSMFLLLLLLLLLLFFFFNGDQCFISGDHFYNFRLQTGVLGALHCHVYSNNNYCHSTFSAVQILKIAYVRRDPLWLRQSLLLTQRLCMRFYWVLSQNNVFFVYFYQEMVNSKSCSWEEHKRE